MFDGIIIGFYIGFAEKLIFWQQSCNISNSTYQSAISFKLISGFRQKWVQAFLQNTYENFYYEGIFGRPHGSGFTVGKSGLLLYINKAGAV
jgi:hypothetical protein